MHTLEITSCLFASVVVNAYYMHCVLYHHLFLLVTVFSVWFHCTHHPWIAIIDKCIAQMAFVIVVWVDAAHIIETQKLWLLLFPCAVLMLWIWESWLLPPEHKHWKDPIHACLHLFGIIGLHCFLWQLYPYKPCVRLMR